jgi:hypothetical protein
MAVDISTSTAALLVLYFQDNLLYTFQELEET